MSSGRLRTGDARPRALGESHSGLGRHRAPRPTRSAPPRPWLRVAGVPFAGPQPARRDTEQPHGMIRKPEAEPPHPRGAQGVSARSAVRVFVCSIVRVSPSAAHAASCRGSRAVSHGARGRHAGAPDPGRPLAVGSGLSRGPGRAGWLACPLSSGGPPTPQDLLRPEVPRCQSTAPPPVGGIPGLGSGTAQALPLLSFCCCGIWGSGWTSKLGKVSSVKTHLWVFSQ